MRAVFPGCWLFLWLATAPAMAQMQVGVRLDKPHHLAGEPIVVSVDVRNVGVQGVKYSSCDANVRLVVVEVDRRSRRTILGCNGGMGSWSGCSVSHPPTLMPGETTTFRSLLKDYDLPPGRYLLKVTGEAGEQFEQTIPLHVVPSTEQALEAAFAPLVADAESADGGRRWYAREAILETAPPFLESLIARFVNDSPTETTAIAALGRIGTPSSRARLKSLLLDAANAPRSSAVLALARIAHRDDLDFFAALLADTNLDEHARRYAAFAVAYIGGDRAVPLLQSALAKAPSELRSSIVGALGNTRSAAAVPILIGLYGHDSVGSMVCNGLSTLTHRSWCDGSGVEPAATRRKWLRWWNEHRDRQPIYGLDDCLVEPAPSTAAASACAAASSAAAAKGRKPPRPPQIKSVSPRIAMPNSGVEVAGYALKGENHESLVVRFMRDGEERRAEVSSIGHKASDEDRHLEFMDVIVPKDLPPGRWQLVVETHGRRSAPFAVVIANIPEMTLTAIWPSEAHPSQHIDIEAATSPRVDDFLLLTDSRGRQWRLETGVAPDGMTLSIPDDAAAGAASVRLGRKENDVERLSAPLRFLVTSDPLPLTPSAIASMRSVAPGQWTDLVEDDDNYFEVRRSDHVEIEFEQAGIKDVSRLAVPDHGAVHFQVPARLKPGAVTVRTRTWIEQTPSRWSLPVNYRVRERPAPVTITSVIARKSRTGIWHGESAPSVPVPPRDALVLRGELPVPTAADLRVHLRRPGVMLELQPTDVDGTIEFALPPQATSGEWSLVVGPRDGKTAARKVMTLRIK